MKRTTYFMIATFFGGFILAAVICLVLLSNPGSRNETVAKYEIGGERVTLPITRPFGKILFENTTESGGYNMKHFGFSVEESDSVTAPVLRTSSEWQRVLTATVAGDTLRVAVDLDSLVDSIMKIQDHGYAYLTSAESWGISVIIPRGMALESVDGRWKPVMLKNFRGGTVKVQTHHSSLVVNQSRLDSLIVPGTGMSRLKVDSSTINYVRIPLGKDNFEVDCCAGTGLIKRMEVCGKKGVKAKNRGTLELADANVATLLWSPAPTDTIGTLDLTIRKGLEVISKGE